MLQGPLSILQGFTLAVEATQATTSRLTHCETSN